MALSSHEDRRIALAAVRDAGVSQGVWIQLVVDLLFQTANPRAMALALILLKEHSSSTWDAVLIGSIEFHKIYDIMRHLAIHDEPVFFMLALVILNRMPRFNIELLLLTSDQQILPGNIYLQALEGFITYSVISPSGELIMQQPTGLMAPEPFSLESLQTYKEDIFRLISDRRHLRRHDASWSATLRKYVAESVHPLALAILVAKCHELNIWNDDSAVTLLDEVTALLPNWIAIPGFISSFLDLSVDDFNALNPRGFEPQGFSDLLMSMPLTREKQSMQYLRTRELCRYLGLTLGKDQFQQLDPQAQDKYFKSIESSHERFLPSGSSMPVKLGGGMFCCGY